MNNDEKFGLKRGGLAAWARYKGEKSQDFKERLGRRDNHYRMKMLNAWANETGGGLKSLWDAPGEMGEEGSNARFDVK